MIAPPGNVRIYLACGVTDMRKSFDTLAPQVQMMLSLDPHDIDDVRAIPYLNSRARRAYEQFLSLPTPRAFIIAPDGG